MGVVVVDLLFQEKTEALEDIFLFKSDSLGGRLLPVEHLGEVVRVRVASFHNTRTVGADVDSALHIFPVKLHLLSAAANRSLSLKSWRRVELCLIGAEHVHVFPQAEVVVAVAVLLVLVEHVGVGDLFAPLVLSEV